MYIRLCQYLFVVDKMIGGEGDFVSCICEKDVWYSLNILIMPSRAEEKTEAWN